MTFTRTASGIANFGKFAGSDLLIYTEGKDKSIVSSSELIFDELFYSSLLGTIFPEKKIKIKCVGNKQNALIYAIKIDESGTQDSVVIVDRDGDDFICSLIPKKSIIYTDGYSWENDFWSHKMTQSVIEDLVCDDIHSAFLHSQIRNIAKRLEVLSCLDITAHINNEVLLPKNGRGCGIGFEFSSLYVLSTSEVRRLIKKFRQLNTLNCPICCQLLTVIFKSNRVRSIQGHLWEHVAIGLINSAAMGIKKQKMPNQIIKNLAMSKFKKNPFMFMNQSTVDYYRHELQERFV